MFSPSLFLTLLISRGKHYEESSGDEYSDIGSPSEASDEGENDADSDKGEGKKRDRTRGKEDTEKRYRYLYNLTHCTCV